MFWLEKYNGNNKNNSYYFITIKIWKILTSQYFLLQKLKIEISWNLKTSRYCIQKILTKILTK